MAGEPIHPQKSIGDSDEIALSLCCRFSAAVLLSPIRDVEACGPFFEDEVFVSNTNPDDLTSFSKGQLGILQARFDSDEYAAAYRYLSGGKLSAEEKAALMPPSPNPDFETAEHWQAEQAAEKDAEELPRPSYGKKPAQNMFQPSPLPTSKSAKKRTLLVASTSPSIT